MKKLNIDILEILFFETHYIKVDINILAINKKKTFVLLTMKIIQNFDALKNDKM